MRAIPMSEIVFNHGLCLGLFLVAIKYEDTFLKYQLFAKLAIFWGLIIVRKDKRFHTQLFKFPHNPVTAVSLTVPKRKHSR